MRTRPIAALIALAALAGFAGEAAGTLGASLSPVPLVYEVHQAFNVTNKSDLPVVAAIEVDGDGWRLETYEFRLGVGDFRSVKVLQAGKDDAVMRVRVRLADPQPAMDTVAVVLEGRLRHQTWFEANGVSPLVVAGLALAVVGLVAALTLRRLRGRS